MFQLDSTAGAALRFASLTAEESLGRLYSATVEALAVDRSIDLSGLLGSPMCVTLEAGPASSRHLHGIVATAEQLGDVLLDEVRHTRYRFALVPRPWLLGRTLDSRIHVGESVPQIVRKVLDDFGFDDVAWRLCGDYPEREYCVQYRESHLDFICRLMEEEGIYFYFEHTKDRHTMVIADAIGAHAPALAAADLPFVPSGHRGHRRAAVIDAWEVTHAMSPARVRLGDYDYLRPGTRIAADRVIDGADAGRRAGIEIVDFPGAAAGYAMDQDDLDRHARVRGEAMNTSRSTFRGTTDAPGIAAGVIFRLREHPIHAYNVEHLVVSSTVEMNGLSFRSRDAEGEDRPAFRCMFRAMPSSQPFRSAQTTPRPVIHGLQTAVVDGPGDEEIAVDQHGRVRVKFFWSSNGGKEAQPSCPVRVASPWAGRGWGALHLPRVGQEVVVGFHEGDPDRPLVIGSLYNQENMPPYALPGEQARSGVVSRSLGGGPGDANEFRFDDTPGKEELYFHAQRDLRKEAENDGFALIGRDATGTTGRDLKQDVGRDAALSARRDAGLSVGRDTVLKTGRRLRIEAMEQIELVAGLARIVMKSTGQIEIRGTTLKIDGLASVNVSAGASLALNAGAAASIKAAAAVSVSSGAAVSVNAGAVLSLTAVGPAMLKGLPPLVG